MGYESYTDGPAYSKIGAYVFTNHSASYRTHDPYTIKYQGDNAIMDWTFYSPIIVSPYLRISSILGIHDHDTEHPKIPSFPSVRPINDVWSATADRMNYGHFLGLNDLSYDGPDLTHTEKNVWHKSYRGDIRDVSTNPGLRVVPYYDGDFLRYAVTDTSQVGGFLHTGSNINGFMTFDLSNVGRDEPESLFGGTYDMYSAMSAYHNAWHTASSPILIYENRDLWTYWISNFSSSSFMEKNRIAIRADYICILNDMMYETIASFKVHLSVDFDFVDCYGPLAVSDAGRIKRDAIRITDFSTVKALTPTLYHGTVPVGPADDSLPIKFGIKSKAGSNANGDDAIYFIYPLSYVTQTGASPISNLDVFSYNGENNIFGRLNLIDRHFRDNLGDLRPSSFISSSDALDNHLLIIKTNMIQTLQHLKDIMSLLPDFSGLGSILAKALRGDPDVLKEIIDWLTEAILKFRFQQKPTADTAVEILISNALEALEQLVHTSEFTAHGVFKYTIPDELRPIPDGVWKLETRSKLRLHVDLSTLMVSYLIGNSVGLLPTLERIWQILPFTFVIDWFTNESKRLHLVQNELNFLCMRTRFCTHSYTLTYYPSDLFLLDYGLQTFGPNRFGIRCYRRELSYWPPYLRDSKKFDFLKPSNSPDPITVGSLLWQLLT